jgi:hypothetical protein
MKKKITEDFVPLKYIDKKSKMTKRNDNEIQYEIGFPSI